MLRIICLLLTLFILYSCASLGNLDPQKDSILIIPTEYIGEKGMNRFGHGLFTISQYGRAVKTISIYSGTKNKIITDLKEGLYVIDSYRFNYSNSDQTSPSREKYLPILLKTGYVTITPFVFIINIFQREGESTTWFRMDFGKLTDEKRIEIINDLSEDINMQEWKVLEYAIECVNGGILE